MYNTQGRALRIDPGCSALAACGHKFILQLTDSAMFQGCRETIDTGWWNRLSVPVPVLVLTFPQRVLWHKPRSRHLSLFPSRDGHHRSLYQNRPDEPFSAPSPDFLLVCSHWMFTGGLLKKKKISNKIVVNYRLFRDATNIHHPAPIEKCFEEHQKK
ncbi:hypothetical protein EAE99_005990 [Botrytis elliptica]|nr:hypothetical protein EAE99_005990 [Botrytis elliptica]